MSSKDILPKSAPDSIRTQSDQLDGGPQTEKSEHLDFEHNWPALDYYNQKSRMKLATDRFLGRFFERSTVKDCTHATAEIDLGLNSPLA